MTGPGHENWPSPGMLPAAAASGLAQVQGRVGQSEPTETLPGLVCSALHTLLGWLPLWPSWVVKGCDDHAGPS